MTPRKHRTANARSISSSLLDEPIEPTTPPPSTPQHSPSPSTHRDAEDMRVLLAMCGVRRVSRAYWIRRSDCAYDWRLGHRPQHQTTGPRPIRLVPGRGTHRIRLWAEPRRRRRMWRETMFTDDKRWHGRRPPRRATTATTERIGRRRSGSMGRRKKASWCPGSRWTVPSPFTAKVLAAQGMARWACRVRARVVVHADPRTASYRATSRPTVTGLKRRLDRLRNGAVDREGRRLRVPRVAAAPALAGKVLSDREENADRLRKWREKKRQEEADADDTA